MDEALSLDGSPYQKCIDIKIGRESSVLAHNVVVTNEHSTHLRTG